MADGALDLRRAVRQGLAWSAASNLVLRLGTLVLGIVLARLLTPEEFGVFAVALTVQSVLLTVADLGFSAELIRSDDPERRAPTVASLGLVTGLFAASLMAFGADELATLLGSPTSAPAIGVLSVTVILAGAGVVPYATLQREFRQKEIFGIAVCDFVVYTAVTLVLVSMGWGVMAIAVGRVLAHGVTFTLQFVVTKQRPHFGCDRRLLAPVLLFGLPIAAANLVSWVLISVDKVAIARLAGPVELGFYVLAFNVSNWPMSALGQVVRAVALPGFARTDHVDRDPSFARGFALTWAFAVPAGVGLAVMSTPLVNVLYGTRWLPSAGVLAVLGVFGAMRLAFDLAVAYLLARGRSAPTLWIQIVWLVALVPTVVLFVGLFGMVGVAWAHVVVATLLVGPAYLIALARAGADVRAVLVKAWQPVLAVVPAAAAAVATNRMVGDSWVTLLLGSTVFAAVYLGLLGAWLRGLFKAVGTSDEGDAPVALRVQVALDAEKR